MRWQEEAGRFETLDLGFVKDFAAPDVMEEAIWRYNRAVGQIQSGSGDIASIALRQLASTYPDFTEAALLSACCQMAWGDVSLALETLEEVQKSDHLSEDERFKTDLYLQAVRADIKEEEMAAERDTGISMYARNRVSDDRKTKIHGDLRSDEQYMQQLSEGGDAAKILMPSSSAKSSFPIVPVLAVLVAILIVVFVLLQLFPGLNPFAKESESSETTTSELASSTTTIEESTTLEPTASPTPTDTEPTPLPSPTPIIPPGDAGPDSDDGERLAWLLAALEHLSLTDDEMEALWAQYMAIFEPTPTPVPPTSSTAVTPTPVPTTTERTTQAPTTEAPTTTDVPTTTTAPTTATPTTTVEATTTTTTTATEEISTKPDAETELSTETSATSTETTTTSSSVEDSTPVEPDPGVVEPNEPTISEED